MTFDEGLAFDRGESAPSGGTHRTLSPPNGASEPLSPDVDPQENPLVLSVRASELPLVSRDPWDRELVWWTPSGPYTASDGEKTNPCVKEIRALSRAALAEAAGLEALARAIEVEKADADPAEAAWIEYRGTLSSSDAIDLPAVYRAFIFAFNAALPQTES